METPQIDRNFEAKKDSVRSPANLLGQNTQFFSLLNEIYNDLMTLHHSVDKEFKTAVRAILMRYIELNSFGDNLRLVFKQSKLDSAQKRLDTLSFCGCTELKHKLQQKPGIPIQHLALLTSFILDYTKASSLNQNCLGFCVFFLFLLFISFILHL